MSQAGPADKLKVPGPDANGRRGATVPYNRYEAENGELSGGAAKKTTSYSITFSTILESIIDWGLSHERLLE